jgi:hypothetical protein
MKSEGPVFSNSTPPYKRKMSTGVLGAWLAALCACCGQANGQTYFVSELHTVHGAHNHLMAGGRAWFTLSEDLKQLSYSIELTGLDLEPDPSRRVDPEDVFGIHLHLIVPGQIGPHILNIFGDPAEEDGDMVVDYAQETLSGIYDAGDATRDPTTGELLPQFFPLTTKVIDDWIDPLMADGLYLAVHTVGQNGAALLHGDVIHVPEPSLAWMMATAASAVVACRGLRNGHVQDRRMRRL